MNDRAAVPAEWDKAEVPIGAVASRRRDVLGGSGRPRLAHATPTNVREAFKKLDCVYS